MDALLRDLTPKVVGAVARRSGDFAIAEDAVQEALIAAVQQWPRDGIPDNPAGWLYQVALRRLADLQRAEMSRRRREAKVVTWLPTVDTVVPAPDDEAHIERDDTLIVLLMSCHPALTPSSAIALTLRAVGGLTTAEIASAFLVPEATMAQRISRAKSTIRTSGVAFALPSPDERGQRLAAVMQVLYLIFNEGYASTGGSSLHRPVLSSEAIRLTRMLLAQTRDEAEVSGLLALMLLTDARLAARTGSAGELIPLDEQDRALWNRAMISEGLALVAQTLPRGQVGPYQLQAAIAALHAEAPTIEATDWRQILMLYEVLMQMGDNPVVRLNRAIAVAMVHGPAEGLRELDAIERDGRLGGSHRVDAVRGHLYERSGERAKAHAHFLAAAERTASVPERNYLMMKAARNASTTTTD